MVQTGIWSHCNENHLQTPDVSHCFVWWLSCWKKKKKKDLQRLLSSVKSRSFCRPRQMIWEKIYISLMMVNYFRTYHWSLITTSGDLLFKAAAERKIPSQRCTSIVRRDEGFFFSPSPKALPWHEVWTLIQQLEGEWDPKAFSKAGSWQGPWLLLSARLQALEEDITAKTSASGSATISPTSRWHPSRSVPRDWEGYTHLASQEFGLEKNKPREARWWPGGLRPKAGCFQEDQCR